MRQFQKLRLEDSAFGNFTDKTLSKSSVMIRLELLFITL